MKNVLVIGAGGQIGSSLIEILEESKRFNIIKKDIEPLEVKDNIDVMHICIRYNENFEKIVIDYIENYKPKLTIINSTVRPGTTKKIYEKTKKSIVHSPVRGRHPDLREGLLKFIKFIGPINEEAGKVAKEHFENMGIKTEILKSPLETEVGKLLSTTYYAVNISFHQEMERICELYGADFKQTVTKFNETCTMDIDHKIPRPVMFPGVIGGHCLLPNIEILKMDVKSDFLDDIIESNELTKRRKEK